MRVAHFQPLVPSIWSLASNRQPVKAVTSPSATLYQVNTTTLVATALPNATGAPAWGDLATAPGRMSDLSLTKATSSTTPGSSVTFTITLTNNGPATDSGVQVIDQLPAGTA